MDITSFLGIITGFGMLYWGYSMDGGNVGALMLISAFIIVFGGSLGSIMMAYGVGQLKNFAKLFVEIFIQPKSNIASTIDFLVKLSETARKEGLLSLEKVIEAEGPKSKIDPLLKRGTLMVIDGTDLEQIRELLETEIYVYEQKCKPEIAMFDSFAAFAPAYGMIGTIMGMIQVLANMSSPEQLCKAIAVAFITTLYGVIIANLFCIPASNKLKIRLAQYSLEKGMIIEGICGIRNGDNPKMLREKLSAYLQLDDKAMKKSKKGTKA